MLRSRGDGFGMPPPPAARDDGGASASNGRIGDDDHWYFGFWETGGGESDAEDDDIEDLATAVSDGRRSFAAEMSGEVGVAERDIKRSRSSNYGQPYCDLRRSQRAPWDDGDQTVCYVGSRFRRV